VIDPVTWGNPLWDQSVQTFATAAARTAAFPSPLPGAVTWLDDVKQLQVWTGTAWDLPVYFYGDTRTVSLASVPVSGTETQVLAITLAAGTWEVEVGGWADWSTTVPPRILLYLASLPDGLDRDTAQVYTAGVGGSIPFTLRAAGVAISAGGGFILVVNQTGAGSGSVVLKNLKIVARRTA
jgi:hypothetical protein